MYQFDYQWISKNGRWQADMTRDKDNIYGSVMSLTLQNNKYSSQAGFIIKKLTKNYITKDFEGRLPKYIITELTGFCREKLKI